MQLSALNSVEKPLSSLQSFGENIFVIIDPRVTNYSQLASGVVPGVEVLVLHPEEDGIEQISSILKQHQNITALHIVSHGALGCLYLGNTQLCLETLDRYATQLRQWNVVDLLLYGCNVATGDTGKQFVAKLHNLSGANIAASTSKIGHTDLGSNWNLDVELGAVNASVAFTPTLQATYVGVFANELYVVTQDNERQARDNVADNDFNVSKGFGDPIEFDIITGTPITSLSFLILSVNDVDRAQGERDRVSLNGNVLGLLEGENDLDFNTVFRLDNPSVLVTGENFVQLDVDVDNDGWFASIKKAQLVTNYQLGTSLGQATLVSSGTNLSTYQPGDAINFSAEIDTNLSSQNLDVEAILRDSNGNAVDFDSRPGSAQFTVNGTAIDPYTWSVNLPSNAAGTWSLDVTVFDANTGNLQFLQTSTFNVGSDPNGIADNDILIAEDKGPLVFSAVQRGQFLGKAGFRLLAFDESFYLSQYRDIANAVSVGAFASGLDHFQQFGQFEGRLSNANAAIFDEGNYLFNNSDVAEAVAAGVFLSGFDHFQQFGQFEGRNPSILYDEDFYLANNSDVAAAVTNGTFKSGFQHFMQSGQYEGRDPSEFFSDSLYLSNYPDVAAAIGNGAFRTAFTHFVQFGKREGRDDNLLYNESYYLAQNADVAAAVASGVFKSGFDHFIQFGQIEDRAPSKLYNESYYLAENADIAAAVTSGVFKSGFDHFIQFGEKEGRFTVAPVSLDGGDGDDILYGGAGGRVIMTGGRDRDQFWIADQVLPRTANTITDFVVGVDAIVINQVAGVSGIADLSLTQQGTDTLVSALGKELATLVGVQATNLNSSFIFSATSPVV